MVADAVMDASPRKAIVLDPFLGSGTTLMAAESTGRVGSGIELDPRYVDTAIRRWQRRTGDFAHRGGDGAKFTDLEAAVLTTTSEEAAA
jgi:DNA modification methylase